MEHAGAPSLASQAVFGLSRTVMRPVTAVLPSNRAGLAGLDVILRGFLATASAPRRGVRVRPVDVAVTGGRVRGDWVCAPGVDSDGPATLYIHGGAFVACSPQTHRGLIGELSAASGRPVFAVAYRKAPRHPFPAAADDALRAYAWLTSSGRQMAIAGDSAGGQLAVATTLSARRRSLPVPAAVLLYSPALDLTGALARARDGARRDAFAPARRIAPAFTHYTGDADPDDERISVLAADLAGFPPTMIHVGGTEMLLDDSRTFARRLHDAGTEPRLRVTPGQIHVFPALFRLLPEARAALRDSGQFLAVHLDDHRREPRAASTA